VSDSIKCPYCKEEQSDALEYGHEIDVDAAIECECCGYEFTYSAQVIYSFTVKCNNKEDHVLNAAKHIFLHVFKVCYIVTMTTPDTVKNCKQFDLMPISWNGHFIQPL